MRSHWLISGTACVCAALGLAFAASNARADMILDHFKVDGASSVDPDADIPASRDITGSTWSINTSGTGDITMSDNVSGGVTLDYSFSPIDPAALNITDFGIDMTGYSGGDASLEYNLIESDYTVHSSGVLTFSGTGVWEFPLTYFDNGPISDIAFARIVYTGLNDTSSVKLDSVYFTQVPEPTAMTTGLIGLALFGLRQLRRRSSRSPITA